MKILIIRFSSIGDIVLTSPVIRCLKKEFPNAEIHYLTKKQFKGILEPNPYVDKVHVLEGDIQPVILNLLKERFRYIIDLHNNIRTRYVKSMLHQAFNSNIETFKVNKLNTRKWLLTNLKINKMPDVSIVDRYFETVRKLGVKNDGQGLDFFIPESEEIKKDDLPMSHSLGYAACVIGGQHETKKMPIEKWKQYCAALPFPIVLLGSKDDISAAEQIRVVDEVKVYNACGKFSLHESADIVKHARFVITHDTGLMHIAAAFKKPIISIWGNTVPEFGMYPYYGFNNLKTNVAPQSYMMQVSKLTCRPCSKIGYAKCPKGHFKCMQKQDIAQLLEVSHGLINATK